MRSYGSTSACESKFVAIAKWWRGTPLSIDTFDSDVASDVTLETGSEDNTSSELSGVEGVLGETAGTSSS